MKKVIKIMSVILIIATICMVTTNVFAANGFIQPENLQGTDVNSTELQEIGNTIIGIIQAVGSVIAVVVLMVIGIKYMMGSAEEKAEYKKTLMPYLVGALILLFASNIVAMLFKLFSQSNG